MKNSINISYAGRRKDRPHISKTVFKASVKQVAAEKKQSVSSLQYVFMTDDELLRLNKDYLNHDTYTDIITFDLSGAEGIEGEIYISLERVLENAMVFGVSAKEELLRVMFHGVLHLMGYKDKSTKDQVAMREAETYCINLYLEKET
jgi:rRNA maturation RNase YbeY